MTALEMRRALDEQIELTKRRKAEEKQKEKEKEDKLNAKAARDAAEMDAQIKADKEAQRMAARDELQKMSELQSKDTQVTRSHRTPSSHPVNTCIIHQCSLSIRPIVPITHLSEDVGVAKLRYTGDKILPYAIIIPC